MASIPQEQLQKISQNLGINFQTTVSVLGLVGEIKPNMPTEIKNTKITQALLGCIAMALNIQSDIMLAQADKSQILVAN